MGVALVDLFFELPVVSFGLNHALCVCAPCAPFGNLLDFNGTVCVLDSRALACVCCFVPIACWQLGNRLLPVGVCVQK